MEESTNRMMGLQIKRVREAARLTQENLAEILDCSPQYVSLMENGRYCISIKMLRRLCEALNVSSDSILFPNSEKNSLEIISYKCNDLSGEQFRLLMEIISRYIEAVTLRAPSEDERDR